MQYRFESECMILKCMILKKSYWCFLESMQNVSEVCKLTKMILCHERNCLSMKYSVLSLVNILDCLEKITWYGSKDVNFVS